MLPDNIMMMIRKDATDLSAKETHHKKFRDCIEVISCDLAEDWYEIYIQSVIEYQGEDEEDDYEGISNYLDMRVTFNYDANLSMASYHEDLVKDGGRGLNTDMIETLEIIFLGWYKQDSDIIQPRLTPPGFYCDNFHRHHYINKYYKWAIYREI